MIFTKLLLDGSISDPSTSGIPLYLPPLEQLHNAPPEFTTSLQSYPSEPPGSPCSPKSSGPIGTSKEEPSYAGLRHQGMSISVTALSPRITAVIPSVNEREHVEHQGSPWSSDLAEFVGSSTYESSLIHALVERPQPPMQDVALHEDPSWGSETVSADGVDGQSGHPPAPMAKPLPRRKARDKVYFCTSCDKRFDRPSALATHSNSHTGKQRERNLLGWRPRPG